MQQPVHRARTYVQCSLKLYIFIGIILQSFWASVFPAGFAKEKQGGVADRRVSLYLGRERSRKDRRKEARTEETMAEQSKIREWEGCRMFLGSCCQTPVSVSLLAPNKAICVINEKHQRCHYVCLGKAVQERFGTVPCVLHPAVSDDL